MNEQSLTRFLSVFSIGLGVAELVAPRQVARLAGINADHHDNLIRMLGLREITSGLGIMQGKPAAFLWSRVAGDAMDLALLGAARQSAGSDRRRVDIAIAAVAGITALDILASVLTSRDHSDPSWRVRYEQADRRGMVHGDPLELRAACDAAMAEPNRRDSNRISEPSAMTADSPTGAP